MNFRQKIIGTVLNGQFVPDNKKVYEKTLEKLEGKRVVYELLENKPFKKVSNKQHGYFHKVVCGVIGNHLGYTPKEMKAILKFEAKIKSVAGLSTRQAENFYEFCRNWAAQEHGCYVPMPNEFDWNDPNDPALII